MTLYNIFNMCYYNIQIFLAFEHPNIKFTLTKTIHITDNKGNIKNFIN